MTPNRLRLACVVSLLALTHFSEAEPAAVRADQPIVVRFGKNTWDASRWQPLRLANQRAPKPFTQLADGIGTSDSTFTRAEYETEADNAVLVHDLGTAEVQVEIDFSIGKGFNGSAAPGLCLSPRIKDGMIESSIAIFVADYALAIWSQDTGADGKSVRYRHLTQLARRSDPARPHVLRCRVSKKEASVAVQVDDSDVVVLSFVGNPHLSFVEREVNSLIGLWGCHGACTFREMKIARPGTLPFLVRAPAGK